MDIRIFFSHPFLLFFFHFQSPCLKLKNLGLDRIGGGGHAKGAMTEWIGLECRMYSVAHFYFYFKVACICFYFPKKLRMRTYQAGKTKKKLKGKHTESSEELVNRVPTSTYTNFVSVDFEKNMPDSCAAFGCTNRRSTTSLQFYVYLQRNDILSKEYQNGSLLKMTS